MTTTDDRTVVSLYDAKTHLSQLGDRAAAGEEIIVTKHGKPKFRITGVEPRQDRPLPGSIALANPEQWRALSDVDWFAPDEDLERLWGTRDNEGSR